MPRPEELEDGFAGFFGAAIVVLLVTLQNMNERVQRFTEIAGAHGLGTGQVLLTNRSLWQGCRISAKLDNSRQNPQCGSFIGEIRTRLDRFQQGQHPFGRRSQ